jgi:hypothetical protein
MSHFMTTFLLATLFFASACSSVKVYKSKDKTFLRSAKTCGLIFCSEILVSDNQGKVLVTDVNGLRASPALVDVMATCNLLKRKAQRARHLKRVLETNNSIELVAKDDFWEFEPSSLEVGCRLVISVVSKRFHEKFEYNVMPKLAI